MKKGVKREISRRDFLDGVALVAGGLALSPLTSSANSGQAFSHVVYPPSLKQLGIAACVHVPMVAIGEECFQLRGIG